MPTEQNSSTQSELSFSVLTKTNTQTSEQNRYSDDCSSIPSPPPPPNIGPVMVYSPLDLSRKSDLRTTVEVEADLPASITDNHSIANLEAVEEIQQEQTESKAKLSIKLQSPNETNLDSDNSDDMNFLQELLSENESEIVISSEMLSTQQSKEHDLNETLTSSKKRAASGSMDGNPKMLSQQRDKHQEANFLNTEDKNKYSCNATSSKQVSVQHESKSVPKNDSQTEIEVQSAKKAKTNNDIAVTSEKCVSKYFKLTSPPQQEPIVNIPTKKVSVAQQTEPNVEIRIFDQLAMAMKDIKTQLIKNRALIERERITSNRERGYSRYLQQIILYEVRMLSEKIKHSDSILGQHQSHTTNSMHLPDKAEVQDIRLDKNYESKSVAERLELFRFKPNKFDSSSIPAMALKDESCSTAASNLPPSTSSKSGALKNHQDENVENVSVSSEEQDNTSNSKPTDTKNIKPKTDNEFFMGLYWSKQNKHFFLMLRQSKGWKTARRTERSKGNTLVFAWIGLKKRVCVGGYIKKFYSKTIEWNAKSKTAKVLGNLDHKSNAQFLIQIIGGILKKKKVSFKHTHISDKFIG